MNGPLVSIIIPVYNAAVGLAKCIETARRQTYENIELLLVNDAAPTLRRTSAACTPGWTHASA